MALIHPFRGYRYNQKLVEDMNKVAVQPYDKITPAMQVEYYRRSPFNAVRITLNREKTGNPDTEYPEAGKTLCEWIERKVLLQDGSPAIYAYYQDYVYEGTRKLQKGFIALLDLKGSESGIIPHERTLQAPKLDRLRLLRSTENNEDSVFMLYSDEGLTVNRIMDASVSDRDPDLEVRDDYGVLHRLWAITEPESVKEIRDSMRPHRLFIADGHHRFETSVNFMKECRERGWVEAQTESFDKRMITCFNIADGVTILPTHRLIRDLPGFDAPSFLERIGNHFDVKDFFKREDLIDAMKREPGRNVFGFYSGDGKPFRLLMLKNEARGDRLLQGYIDEYRNLDVSILHILILEHYLGIDESKLVSQSNVDYARDIDPCIEAVDSGKYQAAFFLNPTTAQQMQSLALKGEKMPQKSTDFYPKLLTGLVFMKMKMRKTSNV
jgi:uncharacterized protein (DUF1015 family)